ncbi:unnamed protein product [Dibothriocephalus latus]|uniref:Uncharacterized protein n=1 Tax=Dibothriocephalus latus TaxID=60516 RepID=A0A3P7LTN2_DIBLA|nr:unnamed protein product [Dibothriocephalus latus]
MPFVSCITDNVPNLDIIGKHSNITIQLTDTVVDVHNEQYRAKETALGNAALDRSLCRLLVTDMDIYGAAK